MRGLRVYETETSGELLS